MSLHKTAFLFYSPLVYSNSTTRTFLRALSKTNHQEKDVFYLQRGNSCDRDYHVVNRRGVKM